MNPFTQLIGLSLVINVSIILMKKGYLPSLGLPGLRSANKETLHVLSFLIISSIFLIVFSIAFFILFESVSDAHSNIRLVSALLHKVVPPGLHCEEVYGDGRCDYRDPWTGIACPEKDPDCDYCATEGWSVNSKCDATCPNLTSYCLFHPKNVCDIRPEDLAVTSIVNYLHDKHMPHTFEARASLAKKYKMLSYQGTPAQNGFLLRKLLEKDLAEQCAHSRVASVDPVENALQ